MSKLFRYTSLGVPGRLFFRCPGCNRDHAVRVDGTEEPRWEWNGSMDKPTFRPSVLTWLEEVDGQPLRRCHSFVTDGKIQFLSDCHHALAGQTVDLPEYEQ